MIPTPALEPESAGAWIALLAFVSVAIGVSFICSILEAVLLSASNSYLEAAMQEGSRGAHKMRRQKDKENIDRSISAILTLNTIAHTVGAVGAGAQAVKIFGAAWVGLISAVLVILILVVSEIIPKTLGAVYWRALMPISAHTISVLLTVLYPVVWSCGWLTNSLKPRKDAPTVTREELEILARVGQQEGTIAEGERRVVRNLLGLDSVQVKDILTPRTVVFALSGSLSAQEAMEDGPLVFSRIPIFEHGPDQVTGYVLRYDIVEAAATGKGSMSLHELARPIHKIPSMMSVARLLETLVSLREHIVVAMDEYGGTDGIVTMEDAIESLLGLEITDESDPATDMRELARKRAERRQRTFRSPDRS